MTMTFVDGFVAAVPTVCRYKFIEHTRCCAQMPFDGKRILFGRFETVLEE